jgi:lipid A 3-O-deacylase
MFLASIYANFWILTLFSIPNAKALAVATLLIVTWSPSVQAESLIFGIGHTKYSHNESEDYPVISVEYQKGPIKSFGQLDIGLATALSINTDGDGYLGVGFYTVYDFKNAWFIETSVMPGAYFNSADRNWLGGHFQIRSLLAVGYAINDRSRISIAATHTSNASTTDFNPGVNAFWLRWHRGF